MERVISADERIRRAEARYYKREMQGNNKNGSRSAQAVKLNLNILQKMFLQIGVCVLIYIGVHVLQATQTTFAQNTLSRISYILSHNTDFNWWYEEITRQLNGLNIFAEDEENDEDEEDVDEESDYEYYPYDYEPEEPYELYDPGVIIDAIDAPEGLTQMELDAKYILANHTLGIPLRGTITSRFGYRDYVLPRFHTGIDIAADTGTPIVAAMDGQVTLVSDVRRLPENI